MLNSPVWLVVISFFFFVRLLISLMSEKCSYSLWSSRDKPCAFLKNIWHLSISCPWCKERTRLPSIISIAVFHFPIIIITNIYLFIYSALGYTMRKLHLIMSQQSWRQLIRLLRMCGYNFPDCKRFCREYSIPYSQNISKNYLNVINLFRCINY